MMLCMLFQIPVGMEGSTINNVMSRHLSGENLDIEIKISGIFRLVSSPNIVSLCTERFV